jgi:hypothetical protein
MTETTLTLVHASKSRGGVLWSKDDYDVYDGERRVIGRFSCPILELASDRIM